MGIILKGEKAEEENVRNAIEKLSNKDNLRAFGYLLYELAGFEDIVAMEKRLEEINARCQEIAEMPGMKKAEKIIDAKKLKETLIVLNKALESGYETIIASRKTYTILNAMDWKPTNTSEAATMYLRYLMRKFATEFIVDAGGQS